MQVTLVITTPEQISGMDKSIARSNLDKITYALQMACEEAGFDVEKKSGESQETTSRAN